MLVDTVAAAAAVQRKPGTVRSWAARGDLERRGRDDRGRTVYSLADVYEVAARTGGGK
ncbi:hypothetical protein ACIPY3_02560 [Paenarthrobacter sp. NPDC089714]|uniref:hypothetical protein n=1 Tax=Paenarthrobacter sp. NPDC089714 TaxID=3364377 RepID=UPI0038134105